MFSDFLAKFCSELQPFFDLIIQKVPSTVVPLRGTAALRLPKGPILHLPSPT